MMKTLLTLICLAFIISSCNEIKKDNIIEETIKFYPDKENKVYKRKIILTEFDSLFYYYDNGQLFKSGKIRKNGKPFGVWNLYAKNGNLREIREWYVIKGHSTINRVWFLDKKGDTLSWRYQDSIFKQKEFINDTLGTRATCYDIIYFRKDTVDFNESLKAYAHLRSPLIREENSQAMVLIANSKTEFNSDFSNENEIELDTFYNLTIDKANQKWFKDVEQKYFTVFGYYFKTPGEKTLRGYLLEYATGEFEDGVDSLTSKKYFEKKIFVRDSIE